MVYAKRKTLKYWDDSEVSRITSLFREIGYVNGFLEAVRFEENPTETKVNLAKSYAKDGLNLIKKYQSLPCEIRNERFVKRLETFCKIFLNPEGSFSKKIDK